MIFLLIRIYLCIVGICNYVSIIFSRSFVIVVAETCELQVTFDCDACIYSQFLNIFVHIIYTQNTTRELFSRFAVSFVSGIVITIIILANYEICNACADYKIDFSEQMKKRHTVRFAETRSTLNESSTRGPLWTRGNCFAIRTRWNLMYDPLGNGCRREAASR